MMQANYTNERKFVCMFILNYVCVCFEFVYVCVRVSGGPVGFWLAREAAVVVERTDEER